MKGHNERISKWAHLSFKHMQLAKYFYLMFEKDVIFVERFSFYKIVKSGDKISNFLVCKISF